MMFFANLYDAEHWARVAAHGVWSVLVADRSSHAFGGCDLYVWDDGKVYA